MSEELTDDTTTELDVTATDAEITNDVADTDDSGSAGVVTTDDGDAGAVDGSAGVSTDDSWRSTYEELGFRNVETPEQAQARLIEAFRQQQREYQEAQRQIQFLSAVDRRLQGYDQPQQPAYQQPAEPLDALDEVLQDWPVIDERLLSQYVVTNEDGSRGLAPNTPEDLKRKVELYQFKQAQWQNVVGDPRALAQIIERRTERLLEQKLDGHITQRTQAEREAAERDQFFAQNEWIFAKNPYTGEVDQNTLSAEGEKFRGYLIQARNEGISTERAQLRYAEALYRAERAAAATAPATQRANVQSVIDATKKNMLGRTNPANKRSTRTTSAGVSDTPQEARERLSLGQLMVMEDVA